MFLYLWYSLFLFLTEFRWTSESHCFLLEYFFFISFFGNHWSRKEIDIEWKWLKEFSVLGMLQSTAEIACRNFCLFLSLYTRVTKHDAVSSTENEQLIWTIGKWSEMSRVVQDSHEGRLKEAWLAEDGSLGISILVRHILFSEKGPEFVS